ncbi:MAG: hypothetical protein ACI9ON_000845 [Limisphaerales bacterium]|jgi:hypothetical protein
MKNVYLVWTIVGALVPILFFLGVFHGDMVGVMGFVPALFVNGPAGGFAADLFITSFVFWTYLFTQKEGPKPWLFIVLNLAIGLSCALPAYLYARTKAQA